MSQGITLPLPMKKGFGATDRVDKWWIEPVWMATALALAMVYTARLLESWFGTVESIMMITESLHQYFLLIYYICYTSIIILDG